MAAISRADYEQILQLIGGIVLASQGAEQCLKVIVPFLGSENTVATNQFAKLEKLQKRMLGHLVGDLVESTTSDSLAFAQHMAWLVNSRNQIVHHFTETYGKQMLAGQAGEVIASLKALQVQLDNFRSLTEQIALVVFEGLRDVTFLNTPEYEQMAQLCDSYRNRVAS